MGCSDKGNSRKNRWILLRSIRSVAMLAGKRRRESPVASEDSPDRGCSCQSVAVMIAAIVVPAGIRSITRMRACLVSGRIAVFEDEGAGRVRDPDLLVDREVERAAALPGLRRVAAAYYCSPYSASSDSKFWSCWRDSSGDVFVACGENLKSRDFGINPYKTEN